MPVTPSPRPYGTWPSPVTAESIVKGANITQELIVDSITGDLYHTESRPSENGRVVLVDTLARVDVIRSAEFNVRSRVHEYGGAPAIIRDGVVYFSNFEDNKVYKCHRSKQEEPPVPITPDDVPYRYSDFQLHPTHTHLLVSVLEDHTHDEPNKVVNTLCIINTNTSAIHPLKAGADFYASPRFSPDGNHIVWQEWYHPDMPWEGSEIHLAKVTYNASYPSEPPLTLSSEVSIAGKKLEISAGYPEWISNESIIFDTDETGYQNPYIYRLDSNQSSPVFPHPIQEDFETPAWKLGWSRRAIFPGGEQGIFSSWKEGRNVLYFVNLPGSSPVQPPIPLESPFITVDNLASLSGTQITFIGGQADQATSIFKASVQTQGTSNTRTLTFTDLNPHPPKFSADYVSKPEPYSLRPAELDGKRPIHVVYYPPTNPEYIGIEGTKPPCIVSVHGGPTAIASQSLSWTVQYFTSRGFAWLDVNYGGSSGYGRSYMGELSGTWGIVDIRDTILAARTLGDSDGDYNLVDQTKLFIRGSSSGGYTVLASCSCPPPLLSSTENTGVVAGNNQDSEDPAKIFTAGTSLYGIGDLAALLKDTHKFESRYADKLLGGEKGGRGEVDIVPIAKERSPISHVDKIKTPLLLLQGSVDRVVPPEQSQAVYDSIKSRGGRAELIIYEGEGHGFRREENMKDALEREVKFYQSFL